jgi:hypothetical protein
MNFFKPLAKFGDAVITASLHIARATPGIGRVFARFEAAYTNWGARRWLMTSYQPARFEVDFNASIEIARKAIYFFQNNPIMRRIEWLKVQYAVGVGGLTVTPDPSDPSMKFEEIEKWTAARQDRWNKFCKSPDISNNLNMWTLTKLWEYQNNRTGNIIVVKTVDEKGQLAIQTIDRLRLQTPTMFASEEGKTVCQGIRLKQMTVPVVEIVDGKRQKIMRTVTTGRPELYYIQDEFEPTKFAEVPAENVIHKFEPFMPGQMVGVPDCHSVINVVHDYEDLHILEMGAAKLAAKIATVENNRTGEKSGLTSRTSKLNITGVDAAGSATSKSALYDYNVTVGAQEIGLMHGDTLKNFMIDRPTVVQQGYWEILENQICMGQNCDRLLVSPYSVQGTVVRASLAVARDAFRRDFELVSSVLREIYEWWSERDVKYNAANLKMKVPADHAACEIYPPEGPDVDVGYSDQGLAIKMELGATNLAQVAGRDGRNWRRVIRQTAQIEKAIDMEAAAAGIDSSRISSKLFKTGKALAADNAAIDNTAGEEETKPQTA